MNECGKLTIYKLENIASAGLMPSEKLVKLVDAYYDELRVGVTRMYAALGANRSIDDLLRVYNTDVLENGYVVIPEDGKQYQVDFIQKNIGKDSVDITLSRVDDLYDIYNEQTENIVSSS